MKDILFTVESLSFISETVFELTLIAAEDLPPARAGQFIHLKVPSGGAMLRRPFCLYQYSKRQISLIIAVVGKGTRIFATLQKGDRVFGVMPIGNGFIPSKAMKKIAVLGGGVGCAPLLMLQKDNPQIECRAFLGFASDTAVLQKFRSDYESAYTVPVTVSTDDGSFGQKGFATQAFLESYEQGYRPDAVYVCGAEGMIKAVAKLCADLKIPGFMSGEVRMGCGVGACLVCACAVKGENGAVHNKRACVDGPVFALEDLVL